MAKKKLLNEAQVRRFMGLAGLKPASRAVIKEMAAQYEQDAEPADAEPEMPDMDAEAPDMDAEAPDMEAGAEDPAETGADVDPSQIEAAVAALQDLESLVQPLADAAGIDMAGGAEMPDMDADMPDMDAEMPDMDAEAPEEEDTDEEDADLAPAEEEELEEVNLQLSEDEVVQEVAKRVARRILKAKRAQTLYNEALGNKRPKRTVKSRMSRKKRRK